MQGNYLALASDLSTIRYVGLILMLLGGIGMIISALLLFAGRKRMKQYVEEELSMAQTQVDVARSPKRNLASMRQICAPRALDASDMRHVVLSDSSGRGGNVVYTRSFSIVGLPKKAEFARTFMGLLNFANCTSSIYIREADKAKLRKSHDRYLDVLESEIAVARKDLESNRVRRLEMERSDIAEQAAAFESGKEDIFEVAFLFTIREYTETDLNAAADRFVQEAQKVGISVAVCYGLQPEAFLMQTPLNSKFPVLTNRTNVFSMAKSNIPFKCFFLKQSALSSIFNYVQNPYYHENGAYMGRNLSGDGVIAWDPFDFSHDSYSAIFAGTTGSGKSATIKILISRFSNTMRFACVDSQCPKGLSEGEYNALCKLLNGQVFTIAANAKEGNVLNIFEVAPTYVVERNGVGAITREYETLELSSKKLELQNIILMMLTYNDAIQASVTIETLSYIQEAITDACTKLYRDKGIEDGNADSLYTMGPIGPVRKALPTFSEFYAELLYQRAITDDPVRRSSLQTMLSLLKEYVREMYYYIENDELRFLSREEFEQCRQNDRGERFTKNGTRIESIRGSRAYYDGQSSMNFSSKTRFVNIDISGLPGSELNLARMIAMIYLNEHFVKARRASEDRIRSCVIYDEVQYLFANDYTRKLLEMLYRTARKQEVSAWVSTQSLTDFKNYPETMAILQNTQNMFLFRHEEDTKEYVQEHTKMTDAQFARLTNLGTSSQITDERTKNQHRGEVCIVDGRSVYFGKVDYMKEVERAFVESNAEELRKMAQGL